MAQARYSATLGLAAMLFGSTGHIQSAIASESAQGAFFDIDGDKIYYQVSGTGYPVLLIHGFPLSHALFGHQQNTFGKQYQVITVDLPGFGQSTTATAKQTETHYATELFSLLDKLNISKAVIGGHSMGGQVTLEMYRQQPQRVRAMILFDTNPAAASIVERAEWPAYGRMAEKMGSASIAPSVVAVMVTGAAIAADPTLQTGITDIVAKAMPTGIAGGGNALATRRDYTAMLPLISVPTLVVEGQDDPVYPLPVAQALAAAIPGSTLAVIPGAAHASMYQEPAKVNEQIARWANTVR